MATFLVILKFIGALLSMLREKNAEIKKKKGEALKEITDGIEKNDRSRITAAFDRINRL